MFLQAMHTPAEAFAQASKYIRFDGQCVRRILNIGVPIALQDILVQFSFLFIQMAVNSMGVMQSAAVMAGENMIKSYFALRTITVEARRRESFESSVLFYNHPCMCCYTIFNEGWGQYGKGASTGS